jgi:DNA topoisomerase VI subunit B
MGTPHKRTAFSQSRAAEYLRLDTLVKMAGRQALDFPRVVVKELMDNALDGAESARRPPEIAVAMWLDGGFMVLSVSDNGDGIPKSVVKRTLDFNTLTSDKALYRTPTRGQQGNALKTIIGMPYALGDGDPRVWIDAGNLRHDISVRLGAGDVIEAGHEIHVLAGESEGTQVSVWLPEPEIRHYRRRVIYKHGIRDLVRGYHLFNPHATVSFSGSVPVIDHMVNRVSPPSTKPKKLTPRPTKTTRSSCQPTRWWSTGSTLRASSASSATTSPTARTSPSASSSGSSVGSATTGR